MPEPWAAYKASLLGPEFHVEETADFPFKKIRGCWRGKELFNKNWGLKIIWKKMMKIYRKRYLQIPFSTLFELSTQTCVIVGGGCLCSLFFSGRWVPLRLSSCLSTKVVFHWTTPCIRIYSSQTQFFHVLPRPIVAGLWEMILGLLQYFTNLVSNWK